MNTISHQFKNHVFMRLFLAVLLLFVFMGPGFANTNDKPSLGMSPASVKALWGYPRSETDTVMDGKKVHVWIYGSKLKALVFFYNGKVIGWH